MTKQELAALRERLEMHSDPVYAASHPDSTDSAMLRAAGAIRDYEAALEAMETEITRLEQAGQREYDRFFAESEKNEALLEVMTMAEAALRSMYGVLDVLAPHDPDTQIKLQARAAIAAIRKATAKEVEDED